MSNKNCVKSVEKWKCLKFTWKMDLPPYNQLVLKYLNSIPFPEQKNVARLGFKILPSMNPDENDRCELQLFSQAFHKIGLQVKEVECSTLNCQLKKICPNEHLQVFQSDCVALPENYQDAVRLPFPSFCVALPDNCQDAVKLPFPSERLPVIKQGQSITLHFRVYVTGFIKAYNYQVRDSYLPINLWTSVMYGKSDGDVELVVDGHVKLAHQAILAARSPVFLKMFQSESFFLETGGRIVIEDLSLLDFHYFLYFIYTGTLRNACNRALKQAAEKYQIQTLLDLCNAAEKVPISEEICNLKISNSHVEQTASEATRCKPVPMALIKKSIANCHGVTTSSGSEDVHVVKLLRDFRDASQRIPFQIDNQGFLLSILGHPSSHASLVWFNRDSAFNINRINIKMMNPSMSSSDHPSTICQLQQTDGEDSQFRTFEVNHSWNTCYVTHIGIHLRIFTSDNAEGFASHQLVDLRHSLCMSSLLTKKILTDVQFQVGGEIIPAHRSVIAARSPVLADLLSRKFDEHHEDDEETELVVALPSVQPDVFRALLRFIYTRSIETIIPQKAQQLGAAAEEFQVKTLASLCRAAANGPSDYEDVLTAALFD